MSTTRKRTPTPITTSKELHRQKVVGSYDVAVISKDDDGKVHVSKHEKPTQHGAWSGLGVGALIGVIFPPSVVAMGALGAVTGGLIGHFRHGMPRSDMKELGELSRRARHRSL